MILSSLMEVQFPNHTFISSRSSHTWISRKRVRKYVGGNLADLDDVASILGGSRRRCDLRVGSMRGGSQGVLRTEYVFLKDFRGMRGFVPLASAEDGVSVDRSDVEEMRDRLNQSLQEGDGNNGLVQALHDAARVFELGIKEQGSRSRVSWFSAAWLGVDRNDWVKKLSYQASVYSLLQAASEISSQGDCKDRDVYMFAQRSLLRQSASLESLIREQLLQKQPEASEWFWSEQVPSVMMSFVQYFEGNPTFTAATFRCKEGTSTVSGCASDVSILKLVLTCITAVMKLGSAKISCSQFLSIVPEITGELLDLLANLLPMHQVYQHIKDIDLGREFFVHFGPRAAACRVKSDGCSEEVVFWVDLVQKQLQQAIDREKIWSRLTTSESIEVLERDLAVFGFFVALGRHAQSFLLANGFDVIDEPIEGLIRYFIGGSVLYYPQLSSISTYQLYVEVVCDELDWLPFFPDLTRTINLANGHESKREGPPNAEAILQLLDVCSHWIQSFIKYSKWVENPSNVKAARFLSRGHKLVTECMGELEILREEMKVRSNRKYVDTESASRSMTVGESASFNKALESVEEAVIRLEELLQKLHASVSASEKEHFRAACSDLERIRKLKKEAEFLEASFRAKTDILLQRDDDGECQTSEIQHQQHPKESQIKRADMTDQSYRDVSEPRGFWSFIIRSPAKNSSGEAFIEDKSIKESVVSEDSGSNEIRRFELLRTELMELEKRFQQSADEMENEEDIKLDADDTEFGDDGDELVRKKENIIEKSVGKMKEASMDVLQGTQLLAIDVAASTGLLRRALTGDELTEKEKKAFKRTLTDLASVVPIGVLMLLPVTAVGHAAMLAAIKRYAPALIPSTYGSERLDLLRKLEKLKATEPNEVNSEANEEKLA